MGRKRPANYEQNKPAHERDYSKVRRLQPKNESQKIYLQSIEDNILTIGLGAAGTGKTFLAVYQAVCHLWSKKIRRIVLTRPVVEAWEKIGYLPGNIDEKLNPYMIPLYDSLFDIVGRDMAKEKIERGSIELAPLGFMRGRTFHDTFLIVDEAQNCTYEQLKMILTRIGENCKVVMNGDLTQSDLKFHKKTSGLHVLEKVLKNVENTGFVNFRNSDVVRSRIVEQIVDAFETFETDQQENGNGEVKK